MRRKRKMHKFGLTMGLNYTGTNMALNGCHNDANAWCEVMRKRKVDQVSTILESQATKDSMVNNIRAAISQADTGDRVYLQYSGHGTIVPPGIQSWVPYDFNWNKPSTWLTYDELDHLFIELEKPGVLVIIISDSCHSAADPRKHLRAMNGGPIFRPRFLPPPPEIQKRIIGYPFGRNILSADQDDLLLAGCRKDQTSADAEIDRKYWGAFTYSMIHKALPKKDDISFQEAVFTSREYLAHEGYDQSPQPCGDPGLLSQPLFV